MPFQQGQSGNPGGRPKEDKELKAIIASKTGGHDYFVDKLMAFIDGAREQKLKFDALVKLMEYYYGKPRQQLEMDHTIEADALGALFDAMKSRKP